MKWMHVDLLCFDWFNLRLSWDWSVFELIQVEIELRLKCVWDQVEIEFEIEWMPDVFFLSDSACCGLPTLRWGCACLCVHALNAFVVSFCYVECSIMAFFASTFFPRLCTFSCARFSISSRCLFLLLEVLIHEGVFSVVQTTKQNVLTYEVSQASKKYWETWC